MWGSGSARPSREHCLPPRPTSSEESSAAEKDKNAKKPRKETKKQKMAKKQAEEDEDDEEIEEDHQPILDEDHDDDGDLDGLDDLLGQGGVLKRPACKRPASAKGRTRKTTQKKPASGKEAGDGVFFQKKYLCNTATLGMMVSALHVLPYNTTPVGRPVHCPLGIWLEIKSLLRPRGAYSVSTLALLPLNPFPLLLPQFSLWQGRSGEGADGCHWFLAIKWVDVSWTTTLTWYKSLTWSFQRKIQKNNVENQVLIYNHIFLGCTYVQIISLGCNQGQRILVISLRHMCLCDDIHSQLPTTNLGWYHPLRWKKTSWMKFQWLDFITFVGQHHCNRFHSPLICLSNLFLWASF